MSKYINLKINACSDPCPWLDSFGHDDADGWCCKSERELDSVKVIPNWCELDDYVTEREDRRGVR